MYLFSGKVLTYTVIRNYMFIHFGANSQLQDYSLVKIHEKEKETTLGFKVVSRSGGIWLESWWSLQCSFLFLVCWPYSGHAPYRLPVFPFLDFGDWKAGGRQEKHFSCLLQISWKLSSVQFCFSLLIKKKRYCLHQGLNRGPLACLAETLPLDQRGFVKIVGAQTHLYTVFFFWSQATPIFFYCHFFSAKF